MKQYISTKIITAEPTTYREYSKKSSLGTVSDELNEDGYMVLYKDKYTWMAADKFNETYTIYDTYIDRLNVERSELAIKVDALESYVKKVQLGETEERTGFYKHIRRLKVMNEYLDVIGIN